MITTLKNITKRGTSLLLFMTLSGALVGCQKQAEAPTPEATQSVSQMQPLELQSGSVEPGLGLAEVKLGNTRAEVEQSLGTPTGHDANEFVKGQTYLLYHNKGVELTLQDDKVEMITLHSQDKDWTAYQGATAQGVGASSTAKQVTEAFGASKDEAPRALRYPDKGIVFRFDVDRTGDGSNSRVQSFSIVAGQGSEP